VRLDNPSVLSKRVADTFITLIAADCEVVGLYVDHVDELFVFANELVHWNVELWGCSDAMPQRFGLVYRDPPLSRGDTARLIDHYLDLVKRELVLGSAEERAMRAWLERLGRGATKLDSAAPSRPMCDGETGAGGAGGAPGAAGESAGGADTRG
jgi:hypothetical protein